MGILEKLAKTKEKMQDVNMMKGSSCLSALIFLVNWKERPSSQYWGVNNCLGECEVLKG